MKTFTEFLKLIIPFFVTTNTSAHMYHGTKELTHSLWYAIPATIITVIYYAGKFYFADRSGNNERNDNRIEIFFLIIISAYPLYSLITSPNIYDLGYILLNVFFFIMDKNMPRLYARINSISNKKSDKPVAKRKRKDTTKKPFDIKPVIKPTTKIHAKIAGKNKPGIEVKIPENKKLKIKQKTINPEVVKDIKASKLVNKKPKLPPNAYFKYSY